MSAVAVGFPSGPNPRVALPARLFISSAFGFCASSSSTDQIVFGRSRQLAQSRHPIFSVWRKFAKRADFVWMIVNESHSLPVTRIGSGEFSSVRTIRHSQPDRVSAQKHWPSEVFHVSTALITTTRLIRFSKFKLPCADGCVLLPVKKKAAPSSLRV
jgi:hypothetical protein